MQVYGRSFRGHGARLSNTWPTYPKEGDNPGKLGLNPHRRWALEGPIAESVPRGCSWHSLGMGLRPIR